MCPCILNMLQRRGKTSRGKREGRKDEMKKRKKKRKENMKVKKEGDIFSERQIEDTKE